ncbi:Bro-N domain-containing protein [Kitasatospora sp. NPDC093679]|uniref:BRO-N domain-containing protein n=1 Tax=Kitasatospora sp. NPDC093679 TaxID=3154983 RepID=UPI003443BDAB
MRDETDMVLVPSSFPITGQPIRVVMIDGEPWFVTADVCRILGLTNPSEAVRSLDSVRVRRVDLRVITLSPAEGNDVSAGGKPYGRGNPVVGVVDEAGLYRLILRSAKPAAQPFQEWITGELLPSIRRGDFDLGHHRARMAETLAEAVGEQVEIITDVTRGDGIGAHVRSDGTVHCRHGEMEFRMPGRGEDSGPPFGPYYSCPSVERVGIRGSVVLPRCPRLKLVELIRHLAETGRRNHPGGTVRCELGRVTFSGAPLDIADLLREIGEA